MAVAALFSCTSSVEYPDPEEARETVIKMERDALDNWSAGLPSKYSIYMAEDASYTDDVLAHNIKIGIEDVQAYLNTLDTIVPPHTYELINPQVQVNKDMAILHLQYVGEMEGVKGSPWKATTVYQYREGEWKMVHANWSVFDPLTYFTKKFAEDN